MAVSGGLLAIAVALFAALGTETEVIAGFNVDGIALILAAVGVIAILRGLLRTGELARRSGAGAWRGGRPVASGGQ